MGALSAFTFYEVMIRDHHQLNKYAFACLIEQLFRFHGKADFSFLIFKVYLLIVRNLNISENNIFFLAITIMASATIFF